MEGVLQRTVTALEQDQPVRRHMDPEGAAKIEEYVAKINDLLEVRIPFHIVSAILFLNLGFFIVLIRANDEEGTDSSSFLSHLTISSWAGLKRQYNCFQSSSRPLDHSLSHPIFRMPFDVFGPEPSPWASCARNIAVPTQPPRRS